MDPVPLTSPLGARLRVVTLDNPPVNSLGHDLRQRLVTALDAAEADPDCSGIIITGAGKLFCAGADAREFGTPASTRAPDLRQVLARLFACRKPVIAAINGAALGGGLELAMACHHRVATAEARLGLPEVNLGLIPGAWGTQMLPRLTGLDFAMDMVARGRAVSAQTGAEAGLIDSVAPPGAAATAAAAAFFDTIADHSDLPDIRQRSVAAPEETDLWLAAQESRLRDDFPGCPAPLAAARAVALAATLPFDEAVILERQAFVDLMASPESAALRHIFFAERDCARVPETKLRPTLGPITVAAVPGSAEVAALLVAALGPTTDDAPLLDLLEPLPVPATGTTVVPARLRTGAGIATDLALALCDNRVVCVEASSTALEGVPAVLGLAQRLGAPAVCTPTPAGTLVLATVAIAAHNAATRAEAEERIAETLRNGHFHRAADGDVLAVHGFSYPRHLGGPLYQAGLRHTKEPQR